MIKQWLFTEDEMRRSVCVLATVNGHGEIVEIHARVSREIGGWYYCTNPPRMHKGLAENWDTARIAVERAIGG